MDKCDLPMGASRRNLYAVVDIMSRSEDREIRECWSGEWEPTVWLRNRRLLSKMIRLDSYLVAWVARNMGAEDLRDCADRYWQTLNL